MTDAGSLNYSGWKEFKIGGLFEIVKGTRLTKADQKSGDINFIGSSAFNNGITATISNDSHIHPGNTLTVNYNGSVGCTFYQANPFWASDDVNVLSPKFEMTRNIGLFIAPVIQSVGSKHAYENKWTMEVMKADIIYLPAAPTGEPDFKFMEQYMRNIFKKSEAGLESLIRADKSMTPVDIHGWRDFKIGELFEVFNSFPYHTKDIIEDVNGIPYIVRSKFNNGMRYRVLKPSNTNPAGVISFGAENATFFYQKEEWCSGNKMYYIDTSNISEDACKFIIVCLMPLTDKYSYDNGLIPNLLRNEFIKLPATPEGEPDFKFMEQYMRSILDEASASLDALLD